MKPENKQRFSIRKYAIGAASVLIGFAFQAQAVVADGVVPVITEDWPTVEEPVATEVAPAKPVVTEEAKKIESEKEENKEAAQVEAPSAKEYKLPETGSQSSEWLIATGLMAALTAYGLSKKKD